MTVVFEEGKVFCAHEWVVGGIIELLEFPKKETTVPQGSFLSMTFYFHFLV
jgi:hypothetical protein